jgi:hypothetical protein
MLAWKRFDRLSVTKAKRGMILKKGECRQQFLGCYDIPAPLQALLYWLFFVPVRGDTHRGTNQGNYCLMNRTVADILWITTIMMICVLEHRK